MAQRPPVLTCSTVIHELRAVARQGPRQDWAGYLVELLLDIRQRAQTVLLNGWLGGLDPEVVAGLRSRFAGHLIQGRQANPRRGSRAANLLDWLEHNNQQVLAFFGLTRPVVNDRQELDVKTLRALFRGLQSFRAAYEDHGVDEITDPRGQTWTIWDLEHLYAQVSKLPGRQQQAIELCFVGNVKEVDAAVTMGVSETNPVSMYANSGLRNLIQMIERGEVPRFRVSRNGHGLAGLDSPSPRPNHDQVAAGSQSSA